MNIFEQRLNQQRQWYGETSGNSFDASITPIADRPPKQPREHEQIIHHPQINSGPTCFGDLFQPYENDLTQNVNYTPIQTLISPTPTFNPETQILQKMFKSNIYPHVKIFHIPIIPSCLFDSIDTVLKSVSYNCSAQQLRDVVAHTIINNDKKKQVMNTICGWIEIVRDAIRSNDLRRIEQMRHVLPYSCRNLKDSDREAIYHEMKKDTYWGDDFALEVLQQQLKLQFVVIDVLEDEKNSKLTYPNRTKWGNYNPSHCVFLLRNGFHIRPLSIHSKFIHNFNEGQEFLQK